MDNFYIYITGDWCYNASGEEHVRMAPEENRRFEVVVDIEEILRAPKLFCLHLALWVGHAEYCRMARRDLQ